MPPADLWEQVDALHNRQGITLNDEGFTVAEYAKRYGLSLPGAHHRLTKLAASGDLIAGLRRIGNRTHRVYRCAR